MITPEQAEGILAADFDTIIETDATTLAEPDRDPVDSRPFLRTTPGEVALADAALEMADTIARLKREYAVIVADPSETDPVQWRYLVGRRPDGTVITTHMPGFASWVDSPELAADIAKHSGLPAGTPYSTRIVPRLVSQPLLEELQEP